MLRNDRRATERTIGPARRAVLVGLLLISLVTLARVVQLAAASADAAKLLPPVRRTAAREGFVANSDSGSGTTRLAAENTPRFASRWRPLPVVKYPHPVRIAARPAEEDEQAETTKGEWLVDPSEWFIGPDELPAPDPSVAGPAAAAPPTDAAAPAPAAEPSIPEELQRPGEGSRPILAPVEELVPAAEPSEEPAEPEVSSPWSPPAAPQEPVFAAPPTSNDVLPAPPTADPATGSVDPHLALFAKNAYPSARECAACHEDIYEQWSISSHAYAGVSPMFHRFEQKLNDLTQGTVGYFCLRCHAPVATALCVSRDEPIWNLPEVAREGVTCITCHRVQYVYGKSNGERRIEPGPMFDPVMGGIGGDGVAEVSRHKEHFKVKTSPDEPGPGQEMHLAGIYFEQLTHSEFCASCHQVAVHPGIKLEVVWEQYRASPACKKGISCQDCHMGREPGLPLGNDFGPVAKVGDRTVHERRVKWNHVFHGPNYSIAHPGVFPFHLKADRWTIREWLEFDWRAGWGTDQFEDRIADGQITVDFPPAWAEADDRYDAREVLEENLKRLDAKRELRRQLMENGSHVAGPFFDAPPCRGQDLKLHYVVTNTNEGHNLLTASLGAQPQLWANVVLTGPDGRRLWETGYTDGYGDLANIHSVDVRHGRVPFDWQLFNLQTMFLVTGVKGTDREFYLPVNFDVDPLPFIRPGVQPISTINHPPLIRMESQSLAPLGSRRVPFKIPGELLRQPGTYRLSFRLRSRAEPPYFMRFCDATPDMLRSMNEWMIDVHPVTVEFHVE